MKRRMLNEEKFADNYVPIDIPESLRDYANELRLLNGIPLSYLLTDTTDLDEESLRFFILDINWIDALLDGAFSLGRVCARDFAVDKTALKTVSSGGDYLETPRMKRMHQNHKTAFGKTNANAANNDSTLVSGFIMRSQLVKKMKGLHLYGYDAKGAPKTDLDDGTPLNILRMDTLFDDILIGLFQGELHEIMIAEPKTGLRFGVSDVSDTGSTISRSIDLRSALDSDDLGKRIDSFCIDGFVDDNGRLHAKKLADAVGGKLKEHGKLDVDKITPSRFAFEMIAVAHRAKFRAEEIKSD